MSSDDCFIPIVIPRSIHDTLTQYRRVMYSTDVMAVFNWFDVIAVNLEHLNFIQFLYCEMHQIWFGDMYNESFGIDNSEHVHGATVRPNNTTRLNNTKLLLGPMVYNEYYQTTRPFCLSLTCSTGLYTCRQLQVQYNDPASIIVVGRSLYHDRIYGSNNQPDIISLTFLIINRAVGPVFMSFDPRL